MTADPTFDYLVMITMGIFVLEIFLSVFVKEDYVFSFFFWLDMISTITLIFDIQTIHKQLFSSEYKPKHKISCHSLFLEFFNCFLVKQLVQHNWQELQKQQKSAQSNLL